MTARYGVEVIAFDDLNVSNFGSLQSPVKRLPPKVTEYQLVSRHGGGYSMQRFR
jgi:hypothetical protein